MRLQAGLIAVLSGLALVAPAMAQNRGQPPSAQSTTGAGCHAAGRAEPATTPAPAARDGTSPGNAGSTGWSGGTGGSYIGTNPAGATRDSPTWQPPTARGLDPISAPARPAPVC